MLGQAESEFPDSGPGLATIRGQIRSSWIVEPAEITYLFEVTDPTLFTQVGRGEMVFHTSPARLYEYACHEGNYSLPGILSAARQAERK